MVIVALVVTFLAVLGGEDPHAKMSEEEFEAEAKRNSMLGAGMLELQKVFHPHRVEQFVEEKLRAKGVVSVSGDPPHDPPDDPAGDPSQDPLDHADAGDEK